MFDNKLIIDFLNEVIEKGCNTKLVEKAKQILKKINGQLPTTKVAGLPERLSPPQRSAD
jgi:hypothetical protein